VMQREAADFPDKGQQRWLQVVVREQLGPQLGNKGIMV
jgi:hypothetical protein